MIDRFFTQHGPILKLLYTSLAWKNNELDRQYLLNICYDALQEYSEMGTYLHRPRIKDAYHSISDAIMLLSFNG